jgi:hypothetical protein
VVDANVVNLGMTSRNGILAGYNQGQISTCFTTGIIRANQDVGGLVGLNHNNILHCYSHGAAIGNISVGGLVGHNGENGIVNQCYSVGEVTGNMETGGLLGANDGDVSGSFWDMDTSGQSGSAGGTGRNTVQMQDINTFLNAGWDFVGYTVNGTEGIWWMPVNNYPGLWWQGH